MIEGKRARFILLGSEVTPQALAERAPYTAAKKSAMGRLSVHWPALARELGEHGITANLVAPGGVISDKDRR